MSKTKTHVSSREAGKRLQLKRSDLLPMAASTFRAVSLRNHLALVALRQGFGHAEIASELLKTAYLTYFICGIDADEGSLETCVAAELTIKASVAHAKMAGKWALKSGHAHYVEKMLCQHDVQLTTLALCTIGAAARRLSQMIEDGGMPNLAARYMRVLKQRCESSAGVVELCSERPVEYG
jgi:hypothetical protein